MKKIKPRCLDDNGVHFVTAQGHWMPCCSVSNYRPFFNTEEFNVLENDNFHKKKTFLDWIEEQTKDYDNAPYVCKKSCGIDVDKKKFYTSGDDAIFIYRKNSSS